MHGYPVAWAIFIEAVKNNNLDALTHFMDTITDPSEALKLNLESESSAAGIAVEDFRDAQANAAFLIGFRDFFEKKNEACLSTLLSYADRVSLPEETLLEIAELYDDGAAFYAKAKARAPGAKMFQDFMKAVHSGNSQGLHIFFDAGLAAEAPQTADDGPLSLKETFKLAMIISVQKGHQASLRSLYQYGPKIGVNLEKMKLYALHAGGVEGLKLFDRLNDTGPKM